MGLRYLTPLNDVRNLIGEADSSLSSPFRRICIRSPRTSFKGVNFLPEEVNII
nr:MAG TPA: hypothetical protein [Caudoviricetes sp.]